MGVWQDPRNFLPLEVLTHRGLGKMFEDPAKTDFRPGGRAAPPGEAKTGSVRTRPTRLERAESVVIAETRRAAPVW